MKSPIPCEHPRIIPVPNLKDLVLRFKAFVLNGVVHKLTLEQVIAYGRKWPYEMFSPKHLDPMNYDQSYVFNMNTGECYPMYMVVPCGKCTICQDRRIKEWGFRCHCESAVSSTIPLFITPSYNDESLPSDGVSKDDVQRFFKRLRIALERLGYKTKLRYFLTSEYGSEEYTNRPHYHGVIWNFPYLDDNFNLGMDMARDLIETCWQKGFVNCKPLLAGGTMYVAKYMGKDNKAPKGKNENFWLCSRKPGLGYEVAKQYESFYLENPSEFMIEVFDRYTGKTIERSLPTYFKRMYFPSVSDVLPLDIRRDFAHFVDLYHCMVDQNSRINGFDSELNEVLRNSYKWILNKFWMLSRPYVDRDRKNFTYIRLNARHREFLEETFLQFRTEFYALYDRLYYYDIDEHYIDYILSLKEIRNSCRLLRPPMIYDTDQLLYDIDQQKLKWKIKRKF